MKTRHIQLCGQNKQALNIKGSECELDARANSESLVYYFATIIRDKLGCNAYGFRIVVIDGDERVPLSFTPFHGLLKADC